MFGPRNSACAVVVRALVSVPAGALFQLSAFSARGVQVKIYGRGVPASLPQLSACRGTSYCYIIPQHILSQYALSSENCPSGRPYTEGLKWHTPIARRTSSMLYRNHLGRHGLFQRTINIILPVSTREMIYLISCVIPVSSKMHHTAIPFNIPKPSPRRRRLATDTTRPGHNQISFWHHRPRALPKRPDALPMAYESA